jgi:hypothetical protein
MRWAHVRVAMRLSQPARDERSLVEVSPAKPAVKLDEQEAKQDEIRAAVRAARAWLSGPAARIVALARLARRGVEMHKRRDVVTRVAQRHRLQQLIRLHT